MVQGYLHEGDCGENAVDRGEVCEYSDAVDPDVTEPSGDAFEIGSSAIFPGMPGVRVLSLPEKEHSFLTCNFSGT